MGKGKQLNLIARRRRPFRTLRRLADDCIAAGEAAHRFGNVTPLSTSFEHVISEIAFELAVKWHAK